MAYGIHSRFFEFVIFIFMAFLLYPAVCFGQNAWNTELIGKAAQDDHFGYYEIYGDYLYLTTTVDYDRHQLVIVDISDRTRPRRLWGMFRDNISPPLAIFENYLFLTSPEADSIIIYSLDDPTLPMEVTRAGIGIITRRMKKLDDDLFCSITDSNCDIIEIRDDLYPSVIQHMTSLTNVHDVLLIGDYVYIAGSANPEPNMYLEVYSISDTLYPVRVYYESVGNGSHANIEKIGNYLYYTCLYHGLKILDISDLLNPVLVDSAYYDYALYNIEATGDYAYIACRFDSLLILDVSDPPNPIPANAIYTQAKSDRLRLIGNKLYFRTDFGILQMYDISDPVNPVIDGRYIVGGHNWDVAKSGNYVYTVKSFGGFRIFDVNDPTHPFGMGYYYTPHQTFSIHIDNDILALADHDGGAHIFSLADPANPVLLSIIDNSTAVEDVLVLDTILFIAEDSCGEGSFSIEDISDPSNPLFLGRSPWSSYGNRHNEIISYGNYVYTSEADSGICVYDVSDPTDPQRIECIETGHSVELFIQDNYLYSADHHDGMNIFDISDPASPVLLSTTPPAQAYSITVHGEYAYLAYKNDIYMDCRTFDITNPLNPVLVGTYDTYGSGIGIYVENDTVYVAGGSGGLWILRHRVPTDIDDGSYIFPTSFYFTNFPTPFNAATVIRYSLPYESEIKLSIYNLLGQRIETLFEGVQNPGKHTLTWNASSFPSGIYFTRLEAGNVSENIKMILLK